MENQIVMLSGLPGNMIGEFAKAAAEQKDIELALVGLGLEEGSFKNPAKEQKSSPDIHIVPPEKHDFALKYNDGNIIVVDFTWPKSALGNAEKYCRAGVPFVMGTTMDADDRKRIEDIVAKSETSALIAPNMAKQVVALQWAMEEFAAKNPELLKGYGLKIIESHQQGKKDTSGTARAMVKYFNQLGIPFDVSDIVMVRDPEKQREMGIPEQYHNGHGWHAYELTAPNHSSDQASILASPNMYFPTGESAFKGMDRYARKIKGDGVDFNVLTFKSPDNTMLFRFGQGVNCVDRPEISPFIINTAFSVIIMHNINGRRPYALGALDDIRYLAGKIAEGSKGQVYSMIDVLKGK